METNITHPTSDNHSARSSGRLSISCIESEIPPFVKKEMAALYQNVYSSTTKLAIYGGLDQTSTYIVRRDGQPQTIFLFRKRGKVVRVLNELISIDDDTVNRFANTIFKSYPSVDTISFRAIRPTIKRLAYPHQLFNHAEDIVIHLPPTIEEYLAKLGKSARRTIRSYSGKLLRSQPSFSYQWYEKGKINEDDVREIIRMNRERMLVKKRVSYIDEAETLRILRMVREYGLVGVATIDGEICGGTIAYASGQNYYVVVTAHRLAYDVFKLGTLCSYFAIEECIKRGGKECHFLWGQYEYKYALLGVQQDLDNLTIYRSSKHLMLNMDRVFMTAVEGNVRKAKLWMHGGLRQHRPLARFVFSVVKGLRAANRLAIDRFTRGT